jgi:signal peptidase I
MTVGPPDEPEPQESGAAAPPSAPPGTLLDEPPKAPEPEKKGGFFRELPVLILIAFGLALLIKTFLAQAFVIPSESMVQTLQVDDRVLVNKLVYRFREPRRGEIVVFIAEHGKEPKSFWGKVRSFLTEGFGVTAPAEKDFIKRVIGLPGETVEVDRKGRTHITTVDGRALILKEPYINAIDRTPFLPLTLLEDQYFVMGDNRPASSDSRKQLGPILRSDIVGKAFIRIWPPRRIGFFHTPSYEDATPDEDAAPRAPPLVGIGVLVAAVAIRRRRAA